MQLRFHVEKNIGRIFLFRLDIECFEKTPMNRLRRRRDMFQVREDPKRVQDLPNFLVKFALAFVW